MKQTTKKIEPFFLMSGDPYDNEYLLDRLFDIANKLNQIIDHINKEGKHE